MDEWDVFKGKKYIVSGLDCFGENLKNGGLLRNKPMLASLEKCRATFRRFGS